MQSTKSMQSGETTQARQEEKAALSTTHTFTQGCNAVRKQNGFKIRYSQGNWLPGTETAVPVLCTPCPPSATRIFAEKYSAATQLEDDSTQHATVVLAGAPSSHAEPVPSKAVQAVRPARAVRAVPAGQAVRPSSPPICQLLAPRIRWHSRRCPRTEALPARNPSSPSWRSPSSPNSV